jgi:hypothetical protein
MLEAHIAPQWSINYGGANGIVRKISEGHCLRFILTNSLTLYVSDEIHEACVLEAIFPLETIKF